MNRRFAGAMTSLHAREVLRNPWTWLAGLALAGIALAFRARGSAVGLVSLVAVLQLYLPPLTIVVAAPLLTRRETWAFWSAMPPPAGAVFRGAAVGIGAGLLLPVLAGGGLAALALGLSPRELLLFLLALVSIVVVWAAAMALASAITLDAPRAMAMGLAAWASGALAYGPVVVAIAVALRDYPLTPLLVASLVANPLELIRVGLLQALSVPVLVGPVGKLVTDTLAGGALAWGLGAVLAWSGAFLALAGWVFARRDR